MFYLCYLYLFRMLVSNTISISNEVCVFLEQWHDMCNRVLPAFSRVHDALSLVLCVMFHRSLFVILSFPAWPLHCLSFFDLWLLITLLVSSHFSGGRRDRGRMVGGFTTTYVISVYHHWVRISIRVRCRTLCHKVWQWLATGFTGYSCFLHQ